MDFSLSHKFGALTGSVTSFLWLRIVMLPKVGNGNDAILLQWKWRNKYGNGNEGTNMEKHHLQGKVAPDNDAKSEIQSLVKINLKLLSKQKKLGMAFTFKEHLPIHSYLVLCIYRVPHHIRHVNLWKHFLNIKVACEFTHSATRTQFTFFVLIFHLLKLVFFFLQMFNLYVKSN